MKVLVVDDSPLIRRIVSDALAGTGLEVGQAAGGAEGLAYLDAHDDVAVVLVDWNMPGIDGIAFVEAVRGQPRFKAVRVVMITTERGTTHVERALRAGVDGYLTKPCNKDTIQEKVRALLPVA